MRAGMMAVLAAAVGLSGCSSYNQVNQGWQGATSPAESGQHGSRASQLASDEEHKIKPMTAQYTNGNTDDTMEMSGNIAAQGNYASAAKQRAAKQDATKPSGTPAPH